MASEKVLQQKKEEVSKLAEEMKEAKLILLTNYRGINVADDTSLRRDLRNVNAKYTIIKNNITRRAVYEFSKDNDYYEIKGGVIDGKVMTTEEIVTLAKLPSRETLLSMLAGALLGNISKVAVALDQVRIQKEEAGEKVSVSVPAEESAPVAEEKAEATDAE